MKPPPATPSHHVRVGLNGATSEQKAMSDIGGMSRVRTCLLVGRSAGDKLFSSNVLQQYNVNHCSGTLVSGERRPPPPPPTTSPRGRENELVSTLFCSVLLDFNNETNCKLFCRESIGCTNLEATSGKLVHGPEQRCTFECLFSPHRLVSSLYKHTG